jgi:hypothetical protein
MSHCHDVVVRPTDDTPELCNDLVHSSNTENPNFGQPLDEKPLCCSTGTAFDRKCTAFLTYLIQLNSVKLKIGKK